MLTINVNPALQGFPRPPDGGVVVPTALNFKPDSIAYPPAPFVNPFPAEPTAPLAPIRPANDGQPLLPVKFVMVPPALEVDVGAETLVPVNVPNFVVTDQGSYQSTAQEAAISFTVASVVDNDTRLPPVLSPPENAAVNLLVTLVPSGKPLTAYGVSLVGRVVQFAVSPTSASRVISANDATTITVPNAGFIPVSGDVALVGGVPYLVSVVVDALTLQYPTSASLNLLITLDGNPNTSPPIPPPTFTPNAEIGQTVQFFVSVLFALRPILMYSNFVVVVPVAEANNVPFLPVAGDVMSVDTARYDGELIAQNTGAGAQNVVPATQALPVGFTAPAGSFPVYLPELGESSSGLPVPEFVVNDQMLVNGTPVDYQPGINETNQSSQTQDVIVGQKTDVLGQPINVYPGAQNRR